MARAVADAIDSGRHLVVRAGTGTGKTLGYLVPAVLCGKRVGRGHRHPCPPGPAGGQGPARSSTPPRPPVHLGGPQGPLELRVRAAPGRGGTGAGGPRRRPATAPTTMARDGGRPAPGQLALDGLAERADPDELAAIAAWAATTATGDRAELAVEPSDAAWAAVSTTSRDCPGRPGCPRGDRCFTEAARDRAAQADVVVVNLHLYGLDLASDGAILPEHDLTVIDEAHVVDDVISATTGVEIGAGRFTHLARLLRGILAEAGDTITGVADSGPVLVVGARRPPRPAADRPAARRPGRGVGRRPPPGRGGPGGAARHPRGCGRRRPGPRHPGPAGGHRPARGDRRGRPRPPTPTSCSSRGPSTPRPSGWPRSTWPGCCASACGRAARRCSPAPRWRRGSGPTSACRSAPTTCSTSAARSTTRPTASSTARPGCPGPPTPAGPTSPSRSWPPSSRPPAGARSRCSPATRPWIAPSTPCASGCRSRCSPRASSRSRRWSSASPATPRPACSPR